LEQGEEATKALVEESGFKFASVVNGNVEEFLNKKVGVWCKIDLVLLFVFFLLDLLSALRHTKIFTAFLHPPEFCCSAHVSQLNRAWQQK
jgi:hypothetical protein